MLNHRWLLSSAVVASALHGFCAAAQGSHCTANLGEVEVRGNLDITARCQLSGTSVRGNVTLFAGGLADRPRREYSRPPRGKTR